MNTNLSLNPEIVEDFEKGTRETLPLYDLSKPAPIKVTFENLEYEVTINPTRKEKKLGAKQRKQFIVKGATGYALPGQTLFIVGSSGAGKTTLLNLISDRIAVGRGERISGK